MSPVYVNRATDQIATSPFTSFDRSTLAKDLIEQTRKSSGTAQPSTEPSVNDRLETAFRQMEEQGIIKSYGSSQVPEQIRSFKESLRNNAAFTADALTCLHNVLSRLKSASQETQAELLKVLQGVKTDGGNLQELFEKNPKVRDLFAGWQFEDKTETATAVAQILRPLLEAANCSVDGADTLSLALGLVRRAEMTSPSTLPHTQRQEEESEVALRKIPELGREIQPSTPADLERRRAKKEALSNAERNGEDRSELSKPGSLTPGKLKESFGSTLVKPLDGGGFELNLKPSGNITEPGSHPTQVILPGGQIQPHQAALKNLFQALDSAESSGNKELEAKARSDLRSVLKQVFPDFVNLNQEALDKIIEALRPHFR
jgi:hypothetical protein